MTPPFSKSIPDEAHISQTLHINQLATYQQIKSQRCQCCASRPQHTHQQKERTSDQRKGGNPALKEHVDLWTPSALTSDRQREKWHGLLTTDDSNGQLSGVQFRQPHLSHTEPFTKNGVSFPGNEVSLPMRSRTTSSGVPLPSGFTPHPV